MTLSQPAVDVTHETPQPACELVASACSVGWGFASSPTVECGILIDTATASGQAIGAGSEAIDRHLVEELARSTDSFNAALQQERLLLAELDRIRSDRFRLHAGLSHLQRRMTPQSSLAPAPADSCSDQPAAASDETTHRRRYQQLRGRIRELEQLLSQSRAENGALRDMLKNAKAESELLRSQRSATARQAESIQRASRVRIETLEQELGRICLVNEQLRFQQSTTELPAQPAQAAAATTKSPTPLRVVSRGEAAADAPSEGPSDQLRRVFSRLRSA